MVEKTFGYKNRVFLEANLPQFIISMTLLLTFAALYTSSLLIYRIFKMGGFNRIEYTVLRRTVDSNNGEYCANDYLANLEDKKYVYMEELYANEH